MAQQPSRVSHLRIPRPTSIAVRSLRDRHPRARARGPGVERGAGDARAPSREGRRLGFLRRFGVRTAPLRSALVAALPERPFNVEFWDGTSVPATNGKAPTFLVRSPLAVSHVIRSPGELGLGRAYVTGLLDVDDLDAVMKLVDEWTEPEIDIRGRTRLALSALVAADLRQLPHRPDLELILHGRTHDPERDARAVRFHYDVSNEFFGLFLDKTMTYSCAIFSRGATTLEEAQETKLEL